MTHRYVWTRFTWQQARNDSGKPRKHVRDADHPNNRDNSIEAGIPFTALCGAEVTPWAEDTRRGACFAPTCQLCTVLLAIELGWPVTDLDKPDQKPCELAVLARRFAWDADQIAQLADALGWPVDKVRALVTPTAQEVAW